MYDFSFTKINLYNIFEINNVKSFTFDIFDTLNLFQEVRAAAQNRAWRNCLYPGWDNSTVKSRVLIRLV